MSSTSALTIDPGFFEWVSGADFSQSRKIMVTPAQDLPRFREVAEKFERQGKIGSAVSLWATVSRFHATLGEFAQAQEARRRGSALAERLPDEQIATSFLVTAEDEWRMAMDEGWDAPMESVGPGTGLGAVLLQYRAIIEASIARRHARMGRCEPAMRRLAAVLPAIERAPAWAETYARIVGDAAETLWLTQRDDHIDIIERNLREKVIEPDYRYVMMDGRLAMAHLCALQGRYDEACDWFSKARAVLDEQGPAPCAPSSTTTRRSCTRAATPPAIATVYRRSSRSPSRSFAASACRAGFAAPRRWAKRSRLNAYPFNSPNRLVRTNMSLSHVVPPNHCGKDFRPRRVPLAANDRACRLSAP
jgi:tetratricopeptide (TPR) repeat protein